MGAIILLCLRLTLSKADLSSWLCILGAVGMADYVSSRPIRAASLSHSAAATIHHANLEHEHDAQVYHSLLYCTLVSKTVKSLLLTALDTSFKKKAPRIREMGHQWVKEQQVLYQ